ncbi:nucleotidyltransferase family protein [Lunatimonas lonarensis]|uniref:nucleotidyltransferase family protein n=1 Tax=Lunatimonas lonarensis TaxID=1232681 RepID=UPI0004B1A965|nr:nucleotidyltransferase family protein [Lunatimonas lonarensis]
MPKTNPPFLDISQLEATYGRPTSIVLLACRVYLGTVPLDSLVSYLHQAPVDWKEVRRLCKSHRITPVAYRVLLRCTPPSPWADILKNELKRMAIHSMEKAKETTRLVSLLRSNGLVAFPYKGLAFSLLFYGDIGLRESGDIDLIIDPSELPLVNELLKADGYDPDEEDFAQFLGWEHFTLTRRGYNLKKLDRRNLPIHLELHWRVIYDYFGVGKFDNRFSYETSEQLSVYDQPLPVQDDFQQFKYLYLHHSLHDGHAYLKTALDIAMGLKKLNPSPTEYTTHPILRELSDHFSLAAAVEASNLLFGSSYALPPMRQNSQLASTLANTTLWDKSLRPEDVGTGFRSYFRFHTALIRKRANFYPELSRKIQFYFQNLVHFFQPNVADYRRFSPKSFFQYQLLWVIRPFRQLIIPTDPLQREERAQRRSQLHQIHKEKV